MPLPYQSKSDEKGPGYNNMAIAGFVLALTLPFLGLVFSWLALRGMKRTQNDNGRALATLGLVISIAASVLGCIWVTFIYVYLSAGRR